MAAKREEAARKVEKLLRQGRLGGASEEYAKVIQAKRKDWATMNALGDLYVRNKQTDQAVTQYRRVADHRPFHRLLLVAYFIEVGLALAVIPWTRFWDRNLAVDALPFLATLLNDSFVRGAVTGLGLVNLWAGFADLAALLRAGARGSSVRRLSTVTVDPSRSDGQS